ncbi:hypothetical protein PVK06_005721 [Gossypium arboreum]|uniref:Reverse transcriptase zinc-binding domain-containing protein n=1 Tax=Gossypium arboreum TaxID=29729 RepID=A0ABR0QVS5_GOSAR|nr:hypothetical protein PVK06_005721 [Gossypium arboreum]
MGCGPYRFFWKALYKLDTTPKVRVFTWRVGHVILPMNVKIALIRRSFEQRCPKYRVEDETLIHDGSFNRRVG